MLAGSPASHRQAHSVAGSSSSGLVLYVPWCLCKVRPTVMGVVGMQTSLENISR